MWLLPSLVVSELGIISPVAVDELLTVAEVAQRLRCSRSMAYRLIQEMPVIRIGRIVRVSVKELDRYIAAHTKVPDAAWMRRRVRRAPESNAPEPGSGWRRPIQPRTKPGTAPASDWRRPIQPRTKPRP